MNPEIKAKWLAALRSGDYKQGVSLLRNKDQFCCLGVLCDIHMKETGTGEWNGSHYSVYNMEDNNQILPYPVAIWAGLEGADRTNPEVKVPSLFDDERVLTRELAALNDAGRSFTDLADLIEAQL